MHYQSPENVEGTPVNMNGGSAVQEEETEAKHAPPMRLAVVGLSCRLPGEASSPEDFWDMCSRGRSAWSPIPESRFNASAFYHPNPDRAGSINTKGGHFMKEDVGLFDAPFFNITLQEARSLDPQQRILLECAYEAFENAGIPNHSIAGRNIGVFTGASFPEYELHNFKDTEVGPMYASTGSALALQSNRISYYFDLQGPSVTMDTACSSSLSALHWACQSLRAGECSAAIVAGCHLNMFPEGFVSMTRSRLISDEGRSYSFDYRGTGFGRGEGAGCIVLKPLEEAEAAGDAIRAVIVGSAVNQDGRTRGISMPSSEAQEAMIRSAYTQAGVDPAKTGYVEAHGTGTKVGDPIEATALHAVFGEGRTPRQPLFVGAVKSNIGHTEGASGVISVIKTVLMLERGFILPNCNFDKGNEEIPFDKWGIKIPKKLVPWPPGKPYASVNNFGFGGSNAHIILEPGPRSKGAGTFNTDPFPRRVYILSGHDKQAVIKRAKDLSGYLVRRPSVFESNLLRNLAYTLGERRSSLQWRLAVSASTDAELTEYLSGEPEPSRSQPEPVIGFVFTGQGAQWYGMGKELLEVYPVFQQTLKTVDECLEALGAGFSIIDELLLRDPSMSSISKAHMSQPACTAIQLGLTDLFSSWGIKPTAVTGHSSGEIAAAYAAGILSLEECVRIAYARGLAASFLTQDGKAHGAMLAVGASAAKVQPFVDALKDKKAVIACVNSESSVTLSGDKEAIVELQTVLDEEQLFTRRLHVDVAYHSHHMQRVSKQYRLLMGQIKPQPSQIPFHSAIHGHAIPAADVQESYWVENLVSRVEFVKALQSLVADNTKITTLLEIGPHPALQSPIKDIVQKHSPNRNIQYASSLKRKVNAVESLQELASTLFVRGFNVDFGAVNFPDIAGSEHKPALLSNLPKYPWNHSERYWHQSRLANNYYNRPSPRNDILGSLCMENVDMEPRWRNIIRLDDFPWIRQHKVHGSNVYPMGGFLSMAIEAMSKHAEIHNTPIERIDLRDIGIPRVLTISENSAVETMVTLKSRSESPSRSINDWHEFQIFSWAEARGWEQHCHGFIRGKEAKETNPVDGHHRKEEASVELSQLISDIRASCLEPLDADTLYTNVESSGVQYGAHFRGLSNVSIGKDKEAMATFCVPDTKDCMPLEYETDCIVHPATLDQCSQIEWILRGYGQTASDVTYMPSRIKKVSVSLAHPIVAGTNLELYARAPVPLSAHQPRCSRILVTGPEDRDDPLIEIDGMVMIPVVNDRGRSGGNDPNALCYKLHWEQCIDLLSADDYKLIPHPRTEDVHGGQRMRMLDRLSEHYLRNVLKIIPENGVSSLESHSQKFYRWAQTICAAVGPAEPMPKENIQRAREMNNAGELMYQVGEVLPQILRGEINPLTPMLEDDLLGKYYHDVDNLRQSYAQVSVCISQMAHQNPDMNILEIGAGTGGATLPILESFMGGSAKKTPRFGHFTYTDISPAFFEKAQVKFEAWEQLMTYQTLDISVDPADQGFELGSYDLIIACNVLHATAEMDTTIANVRSLLKPGGKIVLIEETTSKARHFPFVSLPGWWLSKDETRAHGPLLDDNGWDCVLKANDFSGIDIQLHDYSDPNDRSGSIMISTANGLTSGPKAEGDIVIVADKSLHNSTLTTQLKVAMKDLMGLSPTVASLAEAKVSGKWCIFLGSTELPILSKLDKGVFQTVQRLVSGVRGLLWVTRHSNSDTQSLAANMATGLARTIRSETGLQFVTLDLGEEKSMPDAQGAEHIRKVFNSVFYNKSQIMTDMEFVVRQGHVCVPRLVDNDVLNSSIQHETQMTPPQLQPFQQSDRPLRLTAGNSRMLDELYFTDDLAHDTVLPDDFVEIHVSYVGLNFRDVLLAMGQLHGGNLGQECSGTITGVGAGVTEFKAGDRVCAMSPGSLSTYTRCPAYTAWTLPKDMSLEVAASAATVFSTAYYSLIDLGRLSKGESVLIHAAAGGVGQAAIIVAQHIGANVFVTVGSEEKKNHIMKTYGLKDTQIFFSRDTSFAQGVLHATDGLGVDVALNSLTGDALQATLSCVAPFGRFIEMGKRDIVQNARLEMAPFDKNLSFASVDLGLVREKRPEMFKRLLRNSMEFFIRSRALSRWSISTISISELESGFRALQGGQVIGKMVVKMEDDGSAMVKVHPARKPEKLLRANASYVVVGGSGGIGLDIASWLPDKGATNLILVSRSGAASEEARRTVEELSRNGVTVAVCRCDISSEEDVKSNLGPVLRHMPPVRGVVYGAMVLRDMLFEKMTYEDYMTVIKPRVHGILNLQSILNTMNMTPNLDFFINLSSAASFVGNIGQAQYAATGGFMAALAHYPQAARLPCTTIDLSIVRGVGYLSDDQKREQVSQQLGTSAIDSTDIRCLIIAAIRNEIRDSSEGHCVVGFDFVKTAPVKDLPFWAKDAKLSNLTRLSTLAETAAASSTRDPSNEISAAAAVRQSRSRETAEAGVTTAVIKKLSSILMRPVDELDPSVPISVYGLDSLVAIEVRNWITRELEANLQILEILASDSVPILAGLILRKSSLLSVKIKGEWGYDGEV